MIVEGRLVDAIDGVRWGQVEISGSSIARVGDDLGRASLSFDDRYLLFPGFGDVHVHLRWGEEHKEDFDTAAAAALNGGVTFMLDMPNNPRPPLDAAGLAEKRAACGARAVDVDFYAAVVPGARPVEGHPHYKCYLGPTTGNLLLDEHRAMDTLSAYRGHRVAFHCEDPDVLKMHQDAATHEAQRPPEAEMVSVHGVVTMAGVCGFRPHIAHVSAFRSLGVAGAATTEVTPHHLYFDTENRKRAQRNELLKMNPPLRSPDEREALLGAFLGGRIDMLATDHAPHTIEEKSSTNPSGVPQLDTYGGFVAWLLHQGLSPQSAAARCCWEPGRFYQAARVGRLAPGYRAHLTVLDVAAPWTVRADDLRTKCAWSPFEGETLPGRVELTIASGRVFRGGTEVT